ncbi:DNA excision repair protein ERCC-6-like 2 [Quaeritorhiza haematococci]|nr:DNA excision repair protein ERCC-6-like 2 [Quaeritorhiza haematococci]
MDDIDWSMIIVDECHKVKEPSAQITRCLKGLRVRRRYGLTGTAIQNRFKELETAIKLRDIVLAPVFLRRTKKLIAHQLPKKEDKVVFCPMTDRQVEVYQVRREL